MTALERRDATALIGAIGTHLGNAWQRMQDMV